MSVSQEFHLEYDKLEERPHVPTTFNYNPAQQAFWGSPALETAGASRGAVLTHKHRCCCRCCRSVMLVLKSTPTWQWTGRAGLEYHQRGEREALTTSTLLSSVIFIQVLPPPHHPFPRHPVLLTSHFISAGSVLFTPQASCPSGPRQEKWQYRTCFSDRTKAICFSFPKRTELKSAARISTATTTTLSEQKTCNVHCCTTW